MVTSHIMSLRPIAGRWARLAVLTAVALIVAHFAMGTAEASIRNRQDCQEISGTRYQSSAERTWYETSCLKPVTTPPTPVAAPW